MSDGFQPLIKITPKGDKIIIIIGQPGYENMNVMTEPSQVDCADRSQFLSTGSVVGWNNNSDGQAVRGGNRSIF